MEICYGNLAILIAGGATTYSWYTTKTDGDPVFEGEPL